MDQNKIIEGLQKALANGTGSLDDLNNLLKRAQADIETVKREEAEAAKKAEADRGNKVAEIATRLLNKEMTDEDMAFVMNTFFGQHKLQESWTPANIKSLMAECGSRVEQANRAINRLNDLLKDIGIDINLDADMKNSKPAVKPNKPERSADDVINDFLKSFGL